VFSVARSAGFASCKTFGKQPKHPCFGRSPKRGEGGSPTLSPGIDAGRVCPRALQGRKANQAYTALHLGEGVWGFGKDAEIERPKALQDAKPTKRSYRDREFALFL